MQDEQKQRPREKGLNDPKLGSIDRAVACATCGESMQECVGHFGHIELAVPVFHVGEGFLSSLGEPSESCRCYLLLDLGFVTRTKKLLETVCLNCGKVKLDEVRHFLDDLPFFDTPLPC